MRYFIIVCLLITGCVNQSVLVGVGGAYVLRVPEEQMTGDVQFHISITHVTPITKSLEIHTGWHHYSNGSYFSIGGYPNYGFDTIGSQLVFKLY